VPGEFSRESGHQRVEDARRKEMSPDKNTLDGPSVGSPHGRRKFAGIVGGALAGSIVLGDRLWADPAQPRSLFDKFYGCVAGAFIGAAMGAPVALWSEEQIAKKYGTLKSFHPFRSEGIAAMRPAGTTDGGAEQFKHIALAIIAKQDRVTAEDLVNHWIGIKDDKKFEAMKLGAAPFDRPLMAMGRSGLIPAGIIGTHVPYSHQNITVRSFQPIAMINACDPAEAVRDVHDVGRVYQPLHSDGYHWGASFQAALAMAFRPDATVDSVIAAAGEYADRKIRRNLKRALAVAAKQPEPAQLRKELTEMYCAKGVKCAETYAAEAACKALAIFAAMKGNFEDTIVFAVNLGRDTAGVASAAGALAGALSGASAIPAEWIRTVDDAARRNNYTASQLPTKAYAEGIYRALQNKVQKLKQLAAVLESAGA